MRTVSRRTGLSPHVIRVWERRYGAVAPGRTPTNRRVYREADLHRLRLLQQVTAAGHTIGQAAKLSDDQLQELLHRDAVLPPALAPAQAVSRKASRTAFTPTCLTAVKQMDVRALDAVLQTAALELGTQGFLTQVAAPLAYQAGELWRSGEMTAAHEHFLTAALRDFLGRHNQQFSVSSTAPTLMVATPTGQIHELGAVLVSAAALNLGWQVIYLGTCLPAAEIAGSAREQGVRAVALSLVYPEDDPALPGELKQLRSYLSDDIELIVGGRAAPAYAATLVEIRARVVYALEDFFTTLESLRRASPGRGIKAAS